MPASASGSAERAASSSAGAAGVGSTSAPDGALPVLNERWREKYLITAVVEDTDTSKIWRGEWIDGRQKVILRAFHPAEAEIRSAVWAKLGGIDSPHLQHARDAQRAGEWRIEVADEPAGQPLHVWRAARPSVDGETVKQIVAQLAEAVAALHAFELVHLGLCPDVVFVTESAGSISCKVAGLETLTTFDRKQPVPASADPFYAPPEALGVSLHVPGPGLSTWDWWSLGRVVQETILGRHIVGVLANENSRPASTVLQVKAEVLLQESDVKAPRAGAVEAMPDLEPNLQVLLRGLLTSAQESRWTGDNVDRWIRGLPVKEFYDTPRAERHIRWRGRACTVPEIAGLLQNADHWAETSVQLFESSTPGTLAHFLRWSTNQSAAYQQLVQAHELADSLPLKLSSTAAQREAVTIYALLQLSTGKLIWRGRSLDSAMIAAMMNDLGETDATMVLRGLTTRSTALQIERVDNAGGRLLTELGRTVGDVESVLKRYGWLGANDIPGSARLFRLALEPIPALKAEKDALAKKYAGSDHPAMEKLFKAQTFSRTELVALAWAAPIAEQQCKFYTHAEGACRRAEALRARGAELTSALTWAQFERALGVGRLVLSGWGWFLAAWFVIFVGTAVLWPGPRGLFWGVLPGFVALLFRVVAAFPEQAAIRKIVPNAAWGWRDGPGRCQRELRIAGNGTSRAALEAELKKVREELATLVDVKPQPAPLPALPRFGIVRIAGAVSWLLILGVVGLWGWKGVRHPPSVKEIKAAWGPNVAKSEAEAAAAAATAAKANEGAEKDADVKISWPFNVTGEAVKVSVRLTRAASSEQIAEATKHGRDLVAPYRAETIKTLILMPVTAAADEVAVMIFDGKKGDLMNQQIFLIEFRPIPRTLVELGGRKLVYLDQ